MRIPADIATANRGVAEKWIAGQSRVVPCGGSIVLSRMLGKYLLYLDMEDSSIAPHLAMSGYWEYWITQFFCRTIKPGWSVFDVGANVGYFTLLAADLVGESGFVAALEPQEELAELIRRSLAVNGFTGRSCVVDTAASDAPGHAFLERLEHNSGGASLTQHVHGPGRRVSRSRLDSAPFRTPDFVKIDAEGHEPEIWAGMSRWFENGDLPLVLMEWGASRYDASAFLDRIEADGYGVEIITTDGHPAPTTRDHLLSVGEELEMLWLTPKQ